MELSIKERHKKYRKWLKKQLKETIREYQKVNKGVTYYKKHLVVLTEEEQEDYHNSNTHLKKLDEDIRDLKDKLGYSDESFMFTYIDLHKKSTRLQHFLMLFIWLFLLLLLASFIMFLIISAVMIIG